ncbi:MAG TPA: restriction endonuclease subunit S [Cytophagaceae bacterium]|jgi:type I restriction enzyme S subunit|nr:restriction endonuclease subunit S [Cytophagaceae bacterium]
MNQQKKWGNIQLRELIVVRKGKKPLKLSGFKFPDSVPYLDIEAVEKGKFTQYADTFSTIISTEDDVFIVADGSRSGLVAKGVAGAVGSTIMCLTPLIINKDFLFYFLKSKYNYFNKNTIGSSIPHLNQKIFFNTLVPFPPLEDQKNIVEQLNKNLDDYFNNFKNIENELLKIEDSTKAVLERAVTGNLTKQWRNNKNEILTQDSLPETWSKKTIENISSFIGSGITPKGGSSNYLTTGIPFLRSQNVYPNELRLENVVFISKEMHEQMKRTHVKPNDVLLNITGASIGRVAMIPADFGEANVNQHVCIIRVNQEIDPEYLTIYLNSPVGQKIIMGLQSGVTREGLNYAQIRAIQINCPPIEEQKEIIKKIKTHLSELEYLASEHSGTIQKLNELQQSILQMAFTEDSLKTSSNTSYEENLKIKLRNAKKALLDQRKDEQKKNAKKTQEMRQKTKEKSKLDIVDVLKLKTGKVSAKEIWMESKHQNNIDSFYEELRAKIKSGEIISELSDEEIPQSMLSLKTIQ